MAAAQYRTISSMPLTIGTTECWPLKEAYMCQLNTILLEVYDEYPLALPHKGDEKETKR